MKRYKHVDGICVSSSTFYTYVLLVLDFHLPFLLEQNYAISLNSLAFGSASSITQLFIIYWLRQRCRGSEDRTETIKKPFQYSVAHSATEIAIRAGDRERIREEEQPLPPIGLRNSIQSSILLPSSLNSQINNIICPLASICSHAMVSVGLARRWTRYCIIKHNNVEHVEHCSTNLEYIRWIHLFVNTGEKGTRGTKLKPVHVQTKLIA